MRVLKRSERTALTSLRNVPNFGRSAVARNAPPATPNIRRTLCLKISSIGLELWEKKHLA